MKTLLAFFYFSFLFVSHVFCQDLITTKTGEDIQGKILEINQTEVKYSISDSAFTLPKTDIFMIRYANGTKDIFTENISKPTVATNPKLTSKIYNDSLYIAGRNDAAENYRDYKTASTLTLISTIVFPPLGLVTAIGAAGTTPGRNNLDYPAADLFSQPAYAKGYIKKAHKMKAGQVWSHFGIGCAVTAFAAIFIYPQLK